LSGGLGSAEVFALIKPCLAGHASISRRDHELGNPRGEFVRNLGLEIVTAIELDHFALGVVGGDASLHFGTEQLVSLSS
jgi:hypothetical protein